MKISFILLAPMILGFLTCKAGDKQLTEKSTVVKTEQVSAKQDESKPGEKVFQETCLACHMADGSGIPGMTPSIIKSKMVNGDPGELIKIVLEGKEGKVEINGEMVDGYMPAQPTLTNQQVADVLTYIRSSFENKAEAVFPEDVEKIRNK